MTIWLFGCVWKSGISPKMSLSIGNMTEHDKPWNLEIFRFSHSKKTKSQGSQGQQFNLQTTGLHGVRTVATNRDVVAGDFGTTHPQLDSSSLVILVMGQNPGTPGEPQNSWDLWMFIPLKMVLIGIDPSPYWWYINKHHSRYDSSLIQFTPPGLRSVGFGTHLRSHESQPPVHIHIKQSRNDAGCYCKWM